MAVVGLHGKDCDQFCVLRHKDVDQQSELRKGPPTWLGGGGGQHLLCEMRLRKEGLFSLGKRKESFEGPTRNLLVLMKRLLRRWSLFTDMRGHRTGQRSQTEIGDVQTGHKEKPFHREDSQTLEQILPTKVTRASPSEVSSS